MNGNDEGLPTEITMYVQTAEGFDVQIKVAGLDSAGLTGWIKGMSKRLGEAGFVTSSVAQRNKATVVAREEADSEQEGQPVCPDCHGPTEFKNGKAQNGKPWAGYFCLRTKDEPKNRRHTPVWV